MGCLPVSVLTSTQLTVNCLLVIVYCSLFTVFTVYCLLVLLTLLTINVLLTHEGSLWAGLRFSSGLENPAPPCLRVPCVPLCSLLACFLVGLFPSRVH